MISSPSGSRSVTIASVASASMRWLVSTSRPLTFPASAARASPAPMLRATSATVIGPSKVRWAPSGSVTTGTGSPSRNGRRDWDRTSDHHHVKVMLYH